MSIYKDNDYDVCLICVKINIYCVDNVKQKTLMFYIRSGVFY